MACGTSSSRSMKRFSPFRVIAAGAIWRLFGTQRAGDVLVTALSSDDEQTQMLAGMSLVKAGRRSFDRIEQEIDAGRASASLLRLLPDIEQDRARGVLEKVIGGEDGALKETAKECVDLLDRIEKPD